MLLELYGHPFSSYWMKVLVALYEKDAPFRLRMLSSDHRRRLLDRPSVRRTIDEARPYRSLFPSGAPDRD